MFLDIFLILAGFALLVKGGDFLIDGSVAIAQRARLTPMVIGITVIGFGTSMPELLVSTRAAWAGSSGIAIGNVAGSNIANIALILGATSLICPLPSSRKMMRIDIPFMLVAMVLFMLAAWFTGTIERWQGATMTLLLAGFITGEVRAARKSTGATGNSGNSGESGVGEGTNQAEANLGVPGGTNQAEANLGVAGATEVMPLWKALLLVVVSLAAMVWGADLLIRGASSIAMELGEYYGVSREEMERIVGLTVVAVGTSLPELFASLIAARKGETDMAVGNIVGSVSFNILSVVGIAATITPIADAWQPFALDYAVMLVLALLLWLFLRTHRRIVRWEGAVLLIAYILYIVKTLLM